MVMTLRQAAAQQALEALEAMKAEFRALDLPYGSKAYTQGNDACHSLRAALAEQQEGGVCARCGGLVFDPVIPQKQQEPVAWGMPRKDGVYIDVITPDEHARCEGEYTVPLYAAPQPRREVELTDEEIDALPWGPSYDNPMTLTEGLREFARAVIKAYKTKQGEQT